jgi:hypothetical protein
MSVEPVGKVGSVPENCAVSFAESMRRPQSDVHLRIRILLDTHRYELVATPKIREHVMQRIQRWSDSPTGMFKSHGLVEGEANTTGVHSHGGHELRITKTTTGAQRIFIDA